MKKLHFGGVLFTILLVGVVVIAAGTGTLLGTPNTNGPTTSGAGSNSADSTGSGSMTVENVSLRNRTAEGVLYLDIAVAGELNIEQLGQSIERLYDDPSVNVSTIELVNVQQNVATDGNTVGDSSNGETKELKPDTSVQQNDAAAGDTQGSESSDQRSVVTVAIVTDDRSSSTHVVERVEHYLNDENLAEQSAQRTEQTDDSTAEYTVVSDGRVCKVTTAYYQVDFVVGEPIEQLQGPEGTYLPNELIRFAHGSTEEPIVRRSDGEFITHEVLAERIESQAIEVENGMATVTFSISKGAGPVTLSLVSYTKPGPGWSRAMEHLQEFVDADTETFRAGGPYTLRVDLPDAQVGPCKTPEPRTTTTATPTDSPTETATVESPSAPAPTQTPTPTKPVATLDLRIDDNGQSIPFEFAPVQNGKQYSTVVQLRNVGNTPGNYLCAMVTNVDGAENVRLEPERDPGVQNQPGSELPQYLDVSMAYGRDGEYHGFYGPTPLTAENTKQCVALDEGLARGNPIEFRIVVAVAHEDISNAMSDSATFDVVLTLYDEKPQSSESDSLLE